MPAWLPCRAAALISCTASRWIVEMGAAAILNRSTLDVAVCTSETRKACGGGPDLYQFLLIALQRGDLSVKVPYISAYVSLC